MYFLNGELISITLNKQTNTTLVNLRGNFICFILCDTILSPKIGFDRMALGLLSVNRPDLQFLQKPCKDQTVPQSLSDFHRKQGRSRVPTLFEQSNAQICSYLQSTIMLCLYYYVFLMSPYVFKIFFLAIFGKLTIVLPESSLRFETAVKQFENSKRRSEEKLQKSRR